MKLAFFIFAVTLWSSIFLTGCKKNSVGKTGAEKHYFHPTGAAQVGERLLAHIINYDLNCDYNIYGRWNSTSSPSVTKIIFGKPGNDTCMVVYNDTANLPRYWFPTLRSFAGPAQGYYKFDYSASKDSIKRTAFCRLDSTVLPSANSSLKIPPFVLTKDLVVANGSSVLVDSLYYKTGGCNKINTTNVSYTNNLLVGIGSAILLTSPIGWIAAAGFALMAYDMDVTMTQLANGYAVDLMNSPPSQSDPNYNYSPPSSDQQVFNNNPQQNMDNESGTTVVGGSNDYNGKTVSLNDCNSGNGTTNNYIFNIDDPQGLIINNPNNITGFSMLVISEIGQIKYYPSSNSGNGFISTFNPVPTIPTSNILNLTTCDTWSGNPLAIALLIFDRSGNVINCPGFCASNPPNGAH